MGSSIPFLFAFTFFLFIKTTYGHAVQGYPEGRVTWAVHNCGAAKDGVGIRQSNTTGTKCGVCGDDLRLNITPRSLEYLGKNWPERVINVYRVGQTIRARADIWSNHGGMMDWRLCEDTRMETNNQTCFNQHLLEIVSATNPKNQTSIQATRRAVNIHGGGSLYVTVTLQLPAGLVCERCVLQFTYLGNAGQMFRTCSDVSIVPYVQLLQNQESPQRCLSQALNSSSLVLAACNSSDPLQNIFTLPATWNSMQNESIFFRSSENCLTVNGGAGKPSGTPVVGSYCAKSKPQLAQEWSTINYNATDETFQFQVGNSKNEKLCLTTTDNVITQNTCEIGQNRQIWKVLTYGVD